jgi:hypothetical protein
MVCIFCNVQDLKILLINLGVIFGITAIIITGASTWFSKMLNVLFIDNKLGPLYNSVFLLASNFVNPNTSLLILSEEKLNGSGETGMFKGLYP